ncbi:MAG: enoyl-CoA hydratase/isomerase family protein [Leptospirales bacterium]|nr:enoyl-CoA hydratase/isomerase family protein [Leptospirales bacterium]
MPGFQTSTIQRKNGLIAVLTIDALSPNNTLNKDLLTQFIDKLYELGKSADGVLVNSANPKFFSNGLDGKFLLESDEKTRIETITEMIRAYGKLIAFGKPWIVEIAGHAMAGGAVISSCADYRYMQANSGRIGFSELAVGLPLPLCYIHGIHRIVVPVAVRSVIEGTAYKPEEALEIGLIDGVLEDAEKLRSTVLKRFDGIFRMEQDAFLPTRALYRKDLLNSVQRDEAEDIRLAAQLVKQPVFERAMRNIAGRN